MRISDWSSDVCSSDLFRAHFTDNRDVSDHGVLAEIAASVGLDAARAAAILASDDYAEMVRTEEAYWAEQNITGVPAFILGGRMLVPGAQDPEVFIRVIERKVLRSEEHTSELQSLMRISYA